MFDRLYDTSEQANVQFVGFATERTRYDFGIVYTTAFFGKPMVICMQTNRSCLLDYDDLDHLAHLQRAFQLREEEAEEVSVFLKQLIPYMQFVDQY
ncbi:DUF3055 domain-containing protein [Paenibacillus ginsengarvi]|uniref:DUF3055 domain-containing protein n=1 Tax=Paenibacillus ginsengarvi TaxID=400777 RepID=A0A3B0CSM7_9BACL|nr:DUF3055 domain-containing protein [Paenibacillus ginsengarvi]RKN86708.1 DUF3055 domain-containing protein [Paenibacillus ginsengarvi]